MVGVGWLVIMDDWLSRGGPGGAMLGFFGVAVLLLPIAITYGRLVRTIPDAGAEVAYTEQVFPRWVSFAAGWMMVLAYAIVCPWEAAAIGKLLARVFPPMNDLPLYAVAGKVITLPRLVAGLGLTGGIAWINYRGIRTSGRFQDFATLGLLACFALFVALGFARGTPANVAPLFGPSGAFVSILLVAQIAPYFLTGFESIPKTSEEARPDLAPGTLSRMIMLALVAAGLFYVLVIGAVSWVYPWTDLVAQHIGTETAFARAFASLWIARLILVGAFLSLFKVLNGSFVAATRLVYALGRRGLVAPVFGAVHPRFGTPAFAVALVAAVTALGPFLGDAVLVPISEVGAGVGAVGWLSACVAFIALVRRSGERGGTAIAGTGAVVSVAIVLMKVIPAVPGSFRWPEWLVLGSWCGLGLLLRRSATH